MSLKKAEREPKKSRLPGEDNTSIVRAERGDFLSFPKDVRKCIRLFCSKLESFMLNLAHFHRTEVDISERLMLRGQELSALHGTERLFFWFSERVPRLSWKWVDLIQSVARNGNIAKMEFLLTREVPDAVDVRNAVARAAECGNQEMMQYVMNKYVRKRLGESDAVYDIIELESAAVGGHVHTFEECLSCFAQDALDASVAAEICQIMLRRGHLQLVEWIQNRNSYPWHDEWKLDYLDKRFFKKSFRADAVATRYGHVHILEWMKNNNCNFESSRVLRCAVEYRIWHVVDWVWGKCKVTDDQIWELRSLRPVGVTKTFEFEMLFWRGFPAHHDSLVDLDRHDYFGEADVIEDLKNHPDKYEFKEIDVHGKRTTYVKVRPRYQLTMEFMIKNKPVIN